MPNSIFQLDLKLCSSELSMQMPSHKSVFEPKIFHAFVRKAACMKTLCFSEHAPLQSLREAHANLLAKLLAGECKTYPKRFVRRGFENAPRCPPASYLECSDKTALVVPIDGLGSGAIGALQQCVKLYGALFLQSRAQQKVRLHVGKFDPTQKRVDIKSGAAANDGQFAAPFDVCDSFASAYEEVICGKALFGGNDVEKVMRYALHLFLGYFSRADIEPAIYLPGIRRNNLTIESLRKADRKRAFAACGRAHEHDYSAF